MTVARDEAPALRLRSLTKTFGPVTALDQVDLTVERGEVHGLVGMNGSGKSTLIKILTGVHAAESGQVELWGRETPLPVKHPRSQGIAVVHQQLGLIDSMTISECVGVGIGYRSRWGHVSWRGERAEWTRLAARLDVQLPANRLVGELSTSEKTTVALLRTLRELDASGDQQLLILDEPTVAFSPPEVDKLRGIVRAIADAGGSVLFVSHHLSEVLDFADRITVLRDGRKVATASSKSVNADDLVELMLGEELSAFAEQDRRLSEPEGPPSVSLSAVTTAHLSEFSLEVRVGEIVGVTGLAGMGHDEVTDLVSGNTAPMAGSVELNSQLASRKVRRNLHRGLAIVPSDRARTGLWLDGAARENLTLSIFNRFFVAGLLRHRRERQYASAQVTEHNVRPADRELSIRYFSGGNQQKVVLAKALATAPRVLLLHDPTVGVDIPARTEIYRVVRRVAEDAAVLVISTDYDELAQLCDRVVVLRSGRTVGQLRRPHLSEQAIVTLCNTTPPTDKAHTRVTTGSPR